MDELDEILLDQYHSAQRRKKILKRMKRLMPFEKQLIDGEIANEKLIQFLESQISDKELFNKKPAKKKKTKEIDILAKNPAYEWYKQILYITFFSYKIFSESALEYMNFLKKR